MTTLLLLLCVPFVVRNLRAMPPLVDAEAVDALMAETERIVDGGVR